MKNARILKLSWMADSLLEIITERGSQKFYRPADVHSVTNAIDETEVYMGFYAVTFFVGR